MPAFEPSIEVDVTRGNRVIICATGTNSDMSEPLRLDCSCTDSIPDTQQLSGLATTAHHVVLQISKPVTRSALDQLIAELGIALPGHSTFYSGGTDSRECVTVMKVIDRDKVIENADDIVQAARAFRETATTLCETLAKQENVQPSELVERCTGSGRLSGGWTYGFHGLQCRFEHAKTRQVVDVEIAFGDEFGVLDPYFFGQFVTTTSRFKPLSKLFPSLYHDCRRALDVLEELGSLQRIATNTPFPKIGLVAKSDT